MSAELTAITAAIVVSAVIAWSWASARAEARYWENRYYFLRDAFAHYRANSLRRDPKTGRYMKGR